MLRSVPNNHGAFWSVLERLGESMRVLEGQEAFWRVWESVEEFPGVREHLGAFGFSARAFWSVLEHFGVPWSVHEGSGKSSRVSERFVAFCSIWSFRETLGKFERVSVHY